LAEKDKTSGRLVLRAKSWFRGLGAKGSPKVKKEIKDMVNTTRGESDQRRGSSSTV